VEWPTHPILSKRFQNKSECKTVERYLGLKGRKSSSICGVLLVELWEGNDSFCAPEAMMPD